MRKLRHLPSCRRRRLTSGRAGMRGFGLAQVIVTIALISALAAANSVASRSTNIQNLRLTVDAEITTQAHLIRQRVIQCNLRYPTPGFPTTPGSGLVSDLACPGAPAGYQSLWNSANNPSLPKSPSSHGEWSYANDADGIRITITALAGYVTNPQVTGGQNTAWRRFHSSEADCSQNGSAASVTVWIQKNPSAPAPSAC